MEEPSRTSAGEREARPARQRANFGKYDTFPGRPHRQKVHRSREGTDGGPFLWSTCYVCGPGLGVLFELSRSFTLRSHFYPHFVVKKLKATEVKRFDQGRAARNELSWNSNQAVWLQSLLLHPLSVAQKENA